MVLGLSWRGALYRPGRGAQVGTSSWQFTGGESVLESPPSLLQASSGVVSTPVSPFFLGGTCCALLSDPVESHDTTSPSDPLQTVAGSSGEVNSSSLLDSIHNKCQSGWGRVLGSRLLDSERSSTAHQYIGATSDQAFPEMLDRSSPRAAGPNSKSITKGALGVRRQQLEGISFFCE